MTPRRLGPLLALVSTCLLLQLTVLWAPREDLLGFSPRGTALQSHGEEFARGSIAVAVAEGPLMPIVDYQWSYGFGGSLVMGLLAVPSFALLGETLFALKLTAVALRVLAVIAGFLLLDRIASRRAAWIGGLLLAAAPPGIVVIGTIAWGVHLALSSLVLVVTLLAARIWFAGSERTPLAHLALGVAIGFTIYFGYGSIPTLALIGLLELRRRPWPLVDAQRLLLLGGLLVGLAPWLTYNLRHDWVGLQLYGAEPGEHVSIDAATLLARCGHAFENFAGLLWFRDVGPLPGPLSTAIACAALALLFGAALVAVWPSVRRVAALGRALEPRDIRLALVLQPFVILAAMLATDFNERAAHATDVSAHRYACLALPSVLLAAGVGADALLGRARALRVAGLVAVAALVAANLVGTAGLVDRSQAGVFAETPGHIRSGHGRWLLMRWADQPERFEAILERLDAQRPPDVRVELYRGMLNSLQTLLRPGAVLAPYDAERLDDYRRAVSIVRRRAPPELLD